MVSILLATYNGAEYLPALLASLREQREGFRVLWQDDGSADDTPALLAAVSGQDPRFCPGKCQGQRLGAVGNFLSLMAQDDAPYTALCDQDDVWHADKLTCCLAAMKDAEDRFGADTPLLVHSDCRLIGADGTLLHPSFFARQRWDPAATDLPRLLVQNNVTGCTLLMNATLRRLVTDHADPAAMYMHDWFIALTAAAFGQIVFLPEALVDYRQHGENLMGASRHGLPCRALEALRTPGKARARIHLTYAHTAMFRAACGPSLPVEAARLTAAYLATDELPKMRRIRAVRRLGCVMQHPLTRLGQMIFG